MLNIFKRVSWVFLFFVSSAFAGIDTNLAKFFDSLGFSGNVTSGHAFQGQSAGYYTGGSVYERSGVLDTELLNVQLPKVRAGCGGIDIYSGGVSFIQADELNDTLRNIMSNAGGYVFNLALEEQMPQVASSLKYFNNLAQEMNRFDINSCEMGTALVGSMWPKSREGDRQLCQDLGVANNKFSDYVAARRGCSTGGQVNSILSSATGADKALVTNNINVAWQALQSNSLLKTDPELAELFMSLSGTLIIRAPSSDDASNQIIHLPTLINNKALIKALLEGGEAPVYTCDETVKCLNPSAHPAAIHITEQHALKARVRTLLNDMANKIETDTALTEEEKGLLNATSLPVYKMLTVQEATSRDPSILDVEGYADVIASDLLYEYLEGALSLVSRQSSLLQLPPEKLALFQQDISEARAQVRDQKLTSYQEMMKSAQLIERTQNLERMLMGQLSSHLNQTVTWSQGLRGG